jgi:ribosomal protein S18 acetylase RimI-like enzyme
MRKEMSRQSVGAAPAALRREVVPGDTGAVRAITGSTGFFRPDEIGVAVSLVEERLAKGLESGYEFLFAEVENQTAGYACFGPIACTVVSYDLYWIAVHADFQGRGLGKMLLRESERTIEELGGRRIYIETSSRPQYDPTRKFYLACGYREEAVLEDFYAPDDSKVMYVKVLTQPSAE